MVHLVTPIELFAFFDQNNISHTTYTHDAVFTVEQGHHIKGKIAGGHTKNLFLKDKKGALFLVCALGETPIPLNHLHKSLDCKRLSFGNAELLYQTLGVRPGSVCLFALLNDADTQVQLVLDTAMLKDKLINFHPLENTATTSIPSADMEKFAVKTGHLPIWVDFLHEPPQRMDQSGD